MGKIEANNVIYGTDNASDIKYDNSVSLLESATVKDAIDELTIKKQNVELVSVKGNDINIFDSKESSMFLSNAVVNIFDYTLETLKEINASGTWNNNVYTYKGGTFTVNDDLSITVKSGFTENAGFILWRYKPIKSGTYVLSGEISGSSSTARFGHKIRSGSFSYVNGENKKIVFDKDEELRIDINANPSLTEDMTFYPMLTKTEEKQTYVPQNYDIISCGKNLFDCSYEMLKSANSGYNGVFDDVNKTYTYHGITYKCNDDGSITVNGISENTAQLMLTSSTGSSHINRLRGKKVYFTSWEGVTMSSTTYRTFLEVTKSDGTKSGGWVDSNKAFTFPNDITRLNVYVRVVSPTEAKDVVLKPMIRVVGADDTFEPYKEETIRITPSTKLPISAKSYEGSTNVYNKYQASMEVTYAKSDIGKSILDDVNNKVTELEITEQKMLGWSVPRDCIVKNEIRGNVFIQKVGRIDLGKLSYTYSSENNFFLSSSVSGMLNHPTSECHAYSYDYAFKNIGTAYLPNMTFRKNSASKTEIAFKNDSFTDPEQFKASVDGVYFYYELATPIEMVIDGNEFEIRTQKYEIYNDLPKKPSDYVQDKTGGLQLLKDLNTYCMVIAYTSTSDTNVNKIALYTLGLSPNANNGILKIFKVGGKVELEFREIGTKTSVYKSSTDISNATEVAPWYVFTGTQVS